MFMKNRAYPEQLQREVPRRALTDNATQRFEDTYQILGVQQEAPVKKRHRALWATVTAVCLCCGLLFGANAAFPAFAESLPVVGKFFETLNSSFRNINSSKAAYGTNVGTYDTQAIHVGASSSDYSMEVLEAFSDGKNLVFTMDVTTTSELWDRYDWVGVGSNPNGETTTLTVNGTPVETSFSTTLEQGETDHYTGAVSFPLPEAVEDGTALDVKLSITQLTFPDKTTREGYVYVDVDWNSAFQVTADTRGNRAFAATASDAGVEILNVDATATQTLITTNIPDWYDTNFHPVLYTTDGTELRYSTPATPLTAEATTTVLPFDGAPAGTSQLVLRYYDDEGGMCLQDKVKAEFTIDLTDGTAVTSSTYDDGGVLDLDSPFHYDAISWGDADEPFAGQNAQMELRSVTYRKWESLFLMSIATPYEYREIESSIYTSDGTLLGSSVSVKKAPDGMGNGFFDEDVYFWEASEDPVRCYDLQFSSAYVPVCGEELTVVITDTATGEELLRETVSLTQRYFQ